MDISEIRERYNNGCYNYQMEIPSKVFDNHVFDENLSVKRNREMVAEHNQKVEDMKKEKSRKQAELYKQLTNDVVEYIVDSYDMSEEQARIVERFVYAEKHSFMNDYFSWIDEVAYMVEDVVRIGMLDYLASKKNS